MICFFTCAYNADKTLSRAIDSVLSQTYSNLVYYICDNGSVDNTREIILKYAQIDERVTPILRDVNHTLDTDSTFPLFPFLSEYLRENTQGYFCLLDADDEYTLDFAERMLEFVEENELDVAACRSNFIDVEKNENRNRVSLNENIIVYGKGFSEQFPNYFRYMGSVWGKLFSLSTLRRVVFDLSIFQEDLKYYGDTIITLEILKKASRIGVLAKPLHRYYISKKSLLFSFPIERFKTNRRMPQVYRDFICKKTGMLSKKNESYICELYLRSIQNTLQVIFDADWPLEKKLTIIRDEACHEFTLEMLNHKGVADVHKRNFEKCIRDWIELQALEVSEQNIYNEVSYLLKQRME